MNEMLQSLLDAYYPAYLDVLPERHADGITYTLVAELDEGHESGRPTAESATYMLRIFTRDYGTAQRATARQIINALRDAGWYIQSRGPLDYDANAGYWMYVITITNWEATA